MKKADGDPAPTKAPSQPAKLYEEIRIPVPGHSAGAGEPKKEEASKHETHHEVLVPPPSTYKKSSFETSSAKGVRRSSSGGHPGGSLRQRKASSSASGFVSASLKTFNLIFSEIWNYLKRMFTIPMVHDPISYCRAEDFTSAGDRIYNINEHGNEQTLDMIEAACNYSEKTGVLFDKILQERKNSAMSKKMSGSLDFSQVAPWSESMLDRLQCIFQIFDESGDGSVDLEEMTNMMIEFGDKSTDEDRKKVFTEADIMGKGSLNFSEFVMMLHNVTVRSPDTMPQSVVETFRLIDRNMARIRGLDVVQQLQAGLF